MTEQKAEYHIALPDSWGSIWRANIEQGKRNREQIALLLAENPAMSVAELARRVGCSEQAARKHKKHILQP
jgi:HTH domain